VKRKLFAPAWPAREKLPRRETYRTHARARRLRAFGATHLRPALRPRALRCTVTLTVAASDKP